MCLKPTGLILPYTWVNTRLFLSSAQDKIRQIEIILSLNVFIQFVKFV